jgi:hypothetical protein
MALALGTGASDARVFRLGLQRALGPNGMTNNPAAAGTDDR